MNDYPIKTTITLYARVKQVIGGALVDPVTLTLFLLRPDGSEPDPQPVYPDGGVIRDGIGLYHYVLTPAISGLWSRQWQAQYSDGSGVTSDVTQFNVDPSLFISG